MKKYGLFLAVVFVLVWAPVSQGMVEVTLCDEEFVRGTGEPVTEYRQFPGISGPATIKLFNGAEDGVEKVSSSVIAVNGNVIFDSFNFNQNVYYLEDTLTLTGGMNTLSVLLKSKPGGTITIKILQSVYDLRVDPDVVVLTEIGASAQLRVIGNLSDGREADITSSVYGTAYSSGNANIASVTNEGLIIAMANGATTVSVSNNSLFEQISVMVPIEKAMLTPIDPNKVMTDSETGIDFVIDRILVRFDKSMARLEIEAIIKGLNGKVIGYIPFSNMYQIQINSGNIDEIKSKVNAFLDYPGVEYAGPSILLDLFQQPIDKTIDNESLDDPDDCRIKTYQTIKAINLQDTYADDIWNYILGYVDVYQKPTNRVKLAVVDTGIKLDPEAIRNEFEDVLADCNHFVNPEKEMGCIEPIDLPPYHGTMVCGILAARNDEILHNANMNGIASVLKTENDNPSFQLFVYSMIDPNVNALSVVLIWAALSHIGQLNAAQEDLKNHISIVNMSFGGTLGEWREAHPGLDVISEFVYHFNRNEHTLFVVAAGNDNECVKDYYPAALSSNRETGLQHDNVITVGGASSGGKKRWGFRNEHGEIIKPGSNYGCDDNNDGKVEWVVDVSAPASYVWTTDPGSPTGYGSFDKTSAATPLVAGVAALMKSIVPELEPAQIKEIIKSEGDEITETDEPIGTLVNAFNAIDAVMDPDSDGEYNYKDNCPDTYNPDQADSDGDGIGDVCEEPGGEPNPTIIGSVDTPGLELRVDISDSYAYLASQSREYTGETGGLQVIDVSNPQSPTIVASVEIGNVYDVDVSGSYAFVVDDNNLLVIDISNPQSPAIVSSVETVASHYNCPCHQNVHVSGSYAYVTSKRGAYNFSVIDISNPQSPTIVATMIIYGTTVRTSVYGSYAYVCRGDLGLGVVDISNPQSPAIVAEIYPGMPHDVEVTGQYAYTAGYDWSFEVTDVSNPQSPIIVASLELIGCCSRGLDVSGSYAYVCAGNGLSVIDISNPQSPTIVASVEVPGFAYDVRVSGSYAYVGAYSGGFQVIRIFD